MWDHEVENNELVGMWLYSLYRLYRYSFAKICGHGGSYKDLSSSSSNIIHGVGPLVVPFQSHISRSLQRSTMIPSASWGVVFHYPG